MSRLPASLALILALGAVAQAFQQQPALQPNGTASIAGRVVDAVSNQPIDGVRVSARLGRTTQAIVQSAADGAFELDGLAAGAMALSAGKSGYAGGGYGMRAVNGSTQEFDVAAAEHATGVVLRLWKNAVISGFVTDESGRPIGGMEVTAFPVGVIAGRVSIEAGRRALTDVQGFYTVAGLAPVSYIVSAAPVSGEAPQGRPGGAGARSQFQNYPRVFFPDALTASEAEIVTPAPGTTRNDVDFSLRPRATVAVSGEITGAPAGTTIARVDLVRESAATGVWSNLPTATTSVNAGTFSFPSVPPGRYVARVVQFPPTPAPAGMIGLSQQTLAGSLGFVRQGTSGPLAPMTSSPTWWGQTSVTVGTTAVTDVSIAIKSGARLHGTLAFDGDGARPTPDGLLQSAVGIVAPDGQRLPSFQMARLETDSTFVTAALPPGTYALIPLAGVQSLSGSAPTWPDTWTSIRTSIGGQDQPGELIHLAGADLNVTLTLSERPTEITGTVRDGSGAVRTDASVYIFRTDRALWTAGAPSREVRPNRRGEYKADLPAGEYLVTARVDASVMWMEAASLDKLALGAATVRLARGDKRAQDLVIR